jgi:hypothetical protein
MRGIILRGLSRGLVAVSGCGDGVSADLGVIFCDKSDNNYL